MAVPSRYVHVAEARARFGDRVERFGRFFTVGDPLADAAAEALAAIPRHQREALVDQALTHGVDAAPEAPEAMVCLFHHVESVPFWVDTVRSDRGGAVFLRAGLLGGLVLGCYSLAAAYCSPAGNKPLVFSGRLTEEAPRRLAETGRFVQTVALPGGLRRGADGWKASVRVRLIHASVRRMVARSPRWDTAAWGVPINQADMAGTVLLFSLVVLDGLAKLGYPATPDEREDFLHLWRYAGHLQGVDPELLGATEAEARTVWDLLSSTQAPPDQDSRDLARALLESGVTAARTPEGIARAKRMAGFGYAVSRYLLGEDYADALGYPRTAWRFAVPALRAVAGRVGMLARVLPRGQALALDAGLRYWQRTVEQGLRGQGAVFPMPDAVRHG